MPIEALPPSLTYLKTARWEIVTGGLSDATVYRLIDNTTCYLKVSLKTARIPVSQERDRLLWLQGKIAVPQVLDYAETATHQFLLMSECKGLHPLNDDLEWDAPTRIRVLAQAVRDFHALDTTDCPYHVTFDEQIARAQHRIEQGNIYTSHWTAEEKARGTQALFDELLARKPTQADLVLTHGDFYPVNMCVNEGRQTITGFIDVGLLAVADRYTDLAPIANAIGWHLPHEWIPRFFEAHGAPIDANKLRFYQLLYKFS